MTIRSYSSNFLLQIVLFKKLYICLSKLMVCEE
ncbi:unnamed protein product [Brugia timori]|uniref:Uncharacterized protein n=1 Tax=Brugia timori TaxID=42155 RepID=A0A0R3QK74_9BILA|nr:unnamed protein product [Brugia timori]